MAHFDKDYPKFFRELSKNNNKDWFDENRKRYEKSIKVPFKGFMLDLVEHLQPLYPDADLSSNYSIMRINRDIRFSADKTPYKNHMAGMIMPSGIKDKTRPGFYVQANHEDVRVYSGAHMLDKGQLQNIRQYINDNLKEFNKLISSKSFTNTFGEVHGEKNKRIPKEFQEAAEKQPLFFNKSFYWFFKLKASEVTSDSLVKQLVTNYKKSLPLNAFFDEAMS